MPDPAQFRPLIELARREDLGPASDDVTSRLTIDENLIGVGTLLQKQVGIVCGLPMVQEICRAYDERLRVEMIPGFHMEIIEARYSDQKVTPLLRVRGPMRSLLAAERVILNFLQHLSGVAALTQRFVKRVEGSGALIVDTRKTLPGFRALDKYAVLCGGGANHRAGLYDHVLIKDNHLAAYPLKEMAAAVQKVVQQSRAENPQRQIEVEVDNLDQLREVLRVEGVDFILLDNMDCPTMLEAVAMRDRSGRKGRLQLEASGGVTLETVRSIALTGVERISVGLITHSAPALDIGLDIELQ
ncbi:MAG: carboxylating nicotinate-nucleotide diphosphorylase [Burkholderiales bacterium]|nr:carboxylating nicotinate-nucleotide diphosphorylase [Phycisphaerae bacterium]